MMMMMMMIWHQCKK